MVMHGYPCSKRVRIIETLRPQWPKGDKTLGCNAMSMSYGKYCSQGYV